MSEFELRHESGNGFSWMCLFG